VDGVIRVEILFDMQWIVYYYIHTASWSNHKYIKGWVGQIEGSNTSLIKS